MKIRLVTGVGVVPRFGTGVRKMVDKFELTKDLNRLNEIKDEMQNLIREAKKIVQKYDRHGVSYERARLYWLAQLEIALDKDHEWLGGCMCTMADTIKEISEVEETCEEDAQGNFVPVR